MYTPVHMWTYMYVYVNECAYSFHPHSDPEVDAVINLIFLEEETEVQRGQVISQGPHSL